MMGWQSADNFRWEAGLSAAWAARHGGGVGWATSPPASPLWLGARDNVRQTARARASVCPSCASHDFFLFVRPRKLARRPYRVRARWLPWRSDLTSLVRRAIGMMCSFHWSRSSRRNSQGRGLQMRRCVLGAASPASPTQRWLSRFRLWAMSSSHASRPREPEGTSRPQATPLFSAEVAAAKHPAMVAG